MRLWSETPEEDVQIAAAVRGILSPGESPCGILRSTLAGAQERTSDAWLQLGELGFLGINVPEAHGGSELGLRATMPLLVEAGRALLPVPVAETVAVAVPLLSAYGSPEQQEAWHESIARGEAVIAIAAFAPGRPTVRDELPLVAGRGGGSIVLNGVCDFVPYGATADALLVLAQDEAGGVRIVVLPCDTAGLGFHELTSVDSTSRVVRATFDVVEVPLEATVAADEKCLEFVLEHMWAALGMLMVGAAQRIVEMAVEQATTRTQFGHPIGMYQAVKHRVVDMWLASENLLSLVAYCAHGLATGSADASRVAWAARAYGGTELVRIASENIQLHGAMGFTEELDCHLYLKRSWTWANYWATPLACRSNMARTLRDEAHVGLW